MNELNLVLDMDSTLISNLGVQIIPRPHLQPFLTFCFRNFKSVSIWTAADATWFAAVNHALFQPIMKRISTNIGKHCQFRFVFVRPQGTIKFVIRPEVHFAPRPIFVKELSKLWNSPVRFPDFTQHNTLIVDDTPETFSQNYRNAILIPAFASNNTQDHELLKLMFFLKELGKHYQQHNSILNIDKRNWNSREHVLQSTLQMLYNTSTFNEPVKIKTI